MNTNVLFVLAGCGFLLPAFGPAAAAEAPTLSDHVISDDNYPERKVAFPGGVTEALVETGTRKWALAERATGKAPFYMYMFSRVHPFVEDAKLFDCRFPPRFDPGFPLRADPA
jgi:hypothetical protein